MNDLVSVIIPAYNEPGFLRLAIESALSQGSRVEVVVVDDASDIDLFAVVQEFDGAAVHYRRHKDRRERAVAKSSGLEVATGDWILVLDHDDLLASGCLERLLAHARALNADAVLGLSAEVDADATPAWEAPSVRTAVRRLDWWDIYRSSRHFGNPLVRRDIARSVGFCTSVVPADDYLFAMQLARDGRAYRVPVVVGGWRRHSRQTTAARDVAIIQAASRARRVMLREDVRHSLRVRLEAYDELRGRAYVAWAQGDRSEFRRSVFRAVVMDPRLLASIHGLRAGLAAVMPRP